MYCMYCTRPPPVRCSTFLRLSIAAFSRRNVISILSEKRIASARLVRVRLLGPWRAQAQHTADVTACMLEESIHNLFFPLSQIMCNLIRSWWERDCCPHDFFSSVGASLPFLHHPIHYPHPFPTTLKPALSKCGILFSKAWAYWCDSAMDEGGQRRYWWNVYGCWLVSLLESLWSYDA